MKNLLTFALIFLSSFLFAQQIAPIEGELPSNSIDWNLPTPSSLANETVQFRGEVEPELAALLQYTLDSMAQQREMIGIGAALRTPMGDIWASGSGISHEVPEVDSITADHRIAIGSISKTFTAACILQLYEEGQLDLDDSIGHYLPPYENINSTATVRQLLNHTSGIYNYTNNPDFFATIAGSPEAVFEAWPAPAVLDSFVLAPDFAPGVSWNYSNTGFIMLGEIIKSVTGNEYYDEIRTRFIEPLGLTTVFHLPYDDWQQPTAHLWADFDANGTPDDNNPLFENFISLYTSAGAAGAYFATPSDMVEWMYHLQAGDILTPATLAEMRDFIYLIPTLSYGLGTMTVPYLGMPGWGHGGDIFYAAGTYYIPDEEVTISVQTNDAAFSSVDLDPIIEALLAAYISYEPATFVENIVEENAILVSPNPFQNEVLISYYLPEATEVRLRVLNNLGQVISDLGLQQQVGQQNWYLNENSGAYFGKMKGVYFVQLEIGEKVYVEKIIKL